MDITVCNTGGESQKCPLCGRTVVTVCDTGDGSQRCPSCGGTLMTPHPGTEEDRFVFVHPAGECPTPDPPNQNQVSGDCNGTGDRNCVVHIDDRSGA